MLVDGGNGFSELAEYDSDGNGWIDENDEVYDQLKVWVKDENGKDTLLSRARKPLSGFICAIVSSLPSQSMSKLKDLSEIETGLHLRLITSGSVSTVSKLETNSMLCSSMYLRDMVISRLKLSSLPSAVLTVPVVENEVLSFSS